MIEARIQQLQIPNDGSLLTSIDLSQTHCKLDQLTRLLCALKGRFYVKELKLNTQTIVEALDTSPTRLSPLTVQDKLKFSHSDFVTPIIALQDVLKDSQCGLETLELEDCNLSSFHISQIILALYDNQNLRRLSLRFNAIRREASSAIATLLHLQTKASRGLVALDLSETNLDDDGVRLIAQALQHNHRLRVLNLANNEITLQGLAALYRLMQGNESLIEINLKGNEELAPLEQFDESWLIQIKQRLARNKQVFEEKFTRHRSVLMNVERRFTLSKEAVEQDNVGWLGFLVERKKISETARRSLLANIALLKCFLLKESFTHDVTHWLLERLIGRQEGELDLTIRHDLEQYIDRGKTECLQRHTDHLGQSRWIMNEDRSDDQQIVTLDTHQRQLLHQRLEGRLNQIQRSYTPTDQELHQLEALIERLEYDNGIVDNRVRFYQRDLRALERELRTSDLNRRSTLSELWGAFHRAPDVCCIPDEYQETTWDLQSELLDGALDVNTQDPETGNSLLCWAATHQKWRAAELLIRRGANLFLRNNENKDALEIAASNSLASFEKLSGMIGTKSIEELFGARIEEIEGEEGEEGERGLYAKFKEILDHYGGRYIKRSQLMWLFRFVVGFERNKGSRLEEWHEFYVLLKESWETKQFRELPSKIEAIVNRAPKGWFGGRGKLHEGMLLIAQEMRSFLEENHEFYRQEDIPYQTQLARAALQNQVRQQDREEQGAQEQEEVASGTRSFFGRR